MDNSQTLATGLSGDSAFTSNIHVWLDDPSQLNQLLASSYGSVSLDPEGREQDLGPIQAKYKYANNHLTDYSEFFNPAVMPLEDANIGFAIGDGFSTSIGKKAHQMGFFIADPQSRDRVRLDGRRTDRRRELTFVLPGTSRDFTSDWSGGANRARGNREAVFSSHTLSLRASDADESNQAPVLLADADPPTSYPVIFTPGDKRETVDGNWMREWTLSPFAAPLPNIQQRVMGYLANQPTPVVLGTSTFSGGTVRFEDRKVQTYCSPPSRWGNTKTDPATSRRLEEKRPKPGKRTGRLRPGERNDMAQPFG